MKNFLFILFILFLFGCSSKNETLDQNPIRHFIPPAPVRITPPPPPASQQYSEKQIKPKPIESDTTEKLMIQSKSKQKQISKKFIVDDILAKLLSASMIFTVPQKVNIRDDHFEAKLVIDPTKTLDVLAQQAPKENQKILENIKISETMTARIVAPEFDVRSITNDKQVILSNEPTIWLWSLKPKSPGLHEVHLTIWANVNASGEKGDRQLKIFEKMLFVEITWGQVITNWIDANWGLLSGGIFVPIVGWYVKRKLEKKDKSVKEERE